MKSALPLCLCVLLCGCFGDKPFPDHEPSHTKKVTETTQPYVAAMQDFTFEFSDSVGIFESGENELFAPFGVYQLLAIMYAGAEGESVTQLGEALGVPTDDREDFLYAQRAIINQATASPAFHNASAVWMIWPIEVDPFFADEVGSNLDADVIRLGSAATGARDKINRWARQRSDGMIPELVEDISPDTIFLATNIIALDALWLNPFDEEDSVERPFYTPSGPRQTTFMTGEVRTCSTFQDEQIAALRLDFDDELLSFVMLLPSEDSSVAEVGASLDRERWSEILAKLEPRQHFPVEIPRFKFRSRHRIMEEIKKLLGTDILDLTLMSEELASAPLSRAWQVAYIEVAEQGVRAAAGSGIEAGSAIPLPEFVANRPFLFFVVENETGLILMLGAVYEP